MPIKNIKDYTKEGSTNRILVICKSVLLAYGISLICIVIYGLLLSFTSLSESSLSTVVMSITIVSIALAGIYSALKADSKGWLNGALVGLIYMIVLFLLSFLFSTGVTLDMFIVFRIFMGFITGGLAGVIGINLK